jgi:hypothetical protein
MSSGIHEEEFRQDSGILRVSHSLPEGQHSLSLVSSFPLLRLRVFAALRETFPPRLRYPSFG